MKHCMKSLLSLLLCTVLLLGVAPISALAAPQTPTAIASNIVAKSDISLVVPFTSAGAANSTAKVIKDAGECIWVFRVNNGGTLAYCVEPGAELGDESTIDSAAANKYWTELSKSPAHDDIETGVARAIAIADHLNPGNDHDTQAIHNLVIWEIICGIRDPLTGEVISGKTSLQNSFYNAATQDQANFYTARYTTFVNALKSFGDIPSVLYSSKSTATANPITLNWNATNHRFQATVTDTTGLLSSMNLPSSFTWGYTTVNLSRSGNNLTLWTSEPISGIATSGRINKNHGFNTSETESMLVYGGNLANGDTAQCVVSSAVPDPQAGYLAVKTGASPTIDISVKKVWEKTTTPPESVTVHLKGQYVANTITRSAVLNAENGWTYTFEDLPQITSSGNTYVWSVTEDVVDGYTTTITGNATSGFLVTNTKITTGTKDISGTKTWVDDNNRDGVRPAQIFVNLYADGDLYAQTTASEETEWVYTFAGVPIYNDDGTEVNYTIEEVEVPEYTTSYNGYDIVNSHTNALMTLADAKEWDDDGDRDGIRPDSITIRLYADGVEIDSKVVTEADDWAYEWTGLPKYRDGGIEIVYTITEDPIEGYDTVIDGFNVINTHEPERITVSGTKTWDDKNDQDGYRPKSITVRLYADGVEVDSVEVKADANGEWKYEFTDLFKYRDHGAEIVYTISEDAVAKYITSYNGYDITNTHVTETTRIPVTKIWDDADNQDGVRPDSITVNLYRDGELYDSVELTAEMGWAYEWTDLDRYEDGGLRVNWRIQEERVPNYRTTYKGYEITNTYSPQTVTVAGMKSWVDANDRDGIRPDQITVRLYADGVEIGNKVVTEADNWTYEWTELDRYRDGGVEIVYEVKEDAVDQYTTTYNGYDITNTYVPKTKNITGTKTWIDDNDRDGLRPDQITVRLYRDGVEFKSLEVTPDTNGNWTYEFSEVDVYRDGGVEIVWTVTEDAVEGYTTTINGFDITNTHETATTDVEGVKTWVDDNDRDGLRPDQITVYLYADGEEYDKKTVTAADNWSYSWTGLHKYRDGGTEIVWTIDEDAVAGYTKTVDGFNLTNTHEIETITISGRKIWNDGSNAAELRPEAVTVRLYAGEREVDSVVVNAGTAVTSDVWAFEFADLPAYENGVKINYTVKEDPCDNYVATVMGFDITNTHTPIPVTPETGDLQSDIQMALFLAIICLATSGTLLVVMIRRRKNFESDN